MTLITNLRCFSDLRLQTSDLLPSLQGRKTAPVAQHEKWQNRCPREPWPEDPRLSEEPKQPAEIKTIGPIRDCDLVAG